MDMLAASHARCSEETVQRRNAKPSGDAQTQRQLSLVAAARYRRRIARALQRRDAGAQLSGERNSAQADSLIGVKDLYYISMKKVLGSIQ